MSLLSTKALNKDYGGLHAVVNFEIEIEPGEIVGLIGPNGAGKTTVFNLITAMHPKTSGDVYFAGESITALRPFQIAQKGIARTFQNIRLFKGLSVLDNIRAVLQAHARYGLMGALIHDPAYAASEAEITELARDLLDVLNLGARENVPAGSLPYGDQRRVEIARALALSPKLILLDEPAAGMNPNEVKTLVTLIRSIKERFDLTVLLIEHQMGLVMNVCERLVVMDFGQIIARGAPAEVRQDPIVLEAYLGKGVRMV